jgi:hypothetical protein
MVRHKTRLILKDYKQIAGRKYNKTYIAVVRNETTRLLLSLAAKYDWEIDQLNTVIIFLNSSMNREIYIYNH